MDKWTIRLYDHTGYTGIQFQGCTELGTIGNGSGLRFKDGEGLVHWTSLQYHVEEEKKHVEANAGGAN